MSRASIRTWSTVVAALPLTAAIALPGRLAWREAAREETSFVLLEELGLEAEMLRVGPRIERLPDGRVERSWEVTAESDGVSLGGRGLPVGTGRVVGKDGDVLEIDIDMPSEGRRTYVAELDLRGADPRLRLTEARVRGECLTVGFADDPRDLVLPGSETLGLTLPRDPAVASRHLRACASGPNELAVTPFPGALVSVRAARQAGARASVERPLAGETVLNVNEEVRVGRTWISLARVGNAVWARIVDGARSIPISKRGTTVIGGLGLASDPRYRPPRKWDLWAFQLLTKKLIAVGAIDSGRDHRIELHPEAAPLDFRRVFTSPSAGCFRWRIANLNARSACGFEPSRTGIWEWDARGNLLGLDPRQLRLLLPDDAGADVVPGHLYDRHGRSLEEDALALGLGPLFGVPEDPGGIRSVLEPLLDGEPLSGAQRTLLTLFNVEPHGLPVFLTIDADAQRILVEELARAARELGDFEAGAVLLAASGEVLAMVPHWPAPATLAELREAWRDSGSAGSPYQNIVTAAQLPGSWAKIPVAFTAVDGYGGQVLRADGQGDHELVDRAGEPILHSSAVAIPGRAAIHAHTGESGFGEPCTLRRSIGQSSNTCFVQLDRVLGREVLKAGIEHYARLGATAWRWTLFPVDLTEIGSPFEPFLRRPAMRDAFAVEATEFMEDTLRAERAARPALFAGKSWDQAKRYFTEASWSAAAIGEGQLVAPIVWATVMNALACSGDWRPPRLVRQVGGTPMAEPAAVRLLRPESVAVLERAFHAPFIEEGGVRGTAMDWFQGSRLLEDGYHLIGKTCTAQRRGEGTRGDWSNRGVIASARVLDGNVATVLVYALRVQEPAVHPRSPTRAAPGRVARRVLERLAGLGPAAPSGTALATTRPSTPASPPPATAQR